LHDCKEAVSRLIRNEFVEIDNSFIADMRVVDILERAAKNIQRVSECVANDDPLEIIAFELNSLVDLISEITGEITPDDILDSIFGRFCIGK
jgi:tRNA modification GTPase